MWFLKVLKLSRANYTWTILNNIKVYQLTKKKVPIEAVTPLFASLFTHRNMSYTLLWLTSHFHHAIVLFKNISTICLTIFSHASDQTNI